MSRGGFGGGGRTGVQNLPFAVDAALEDQINADRDNTVDDDDWTNVLYPVRKIEKLKSYPTTDHCQPIPIFMAPPPTVRERKLVQIHRRHQAAMQNSPLFMDVPRTGKRDATDFNAFEDVTTFTNKKAKRSGGLPNLKKLPIVKELMPRELWDIIIDGEGDEATEPRKNLDFLKRKRLDKLAQFDEGGDAEVTADADDDAEEREVDDEDRVDLPEDDNFSEDDDDMGEDYNAEQYFDNGDGIDDDGDDGGGEDAW